MVKYSIFVFIILAIVTCRRSDEFPDCSVRARGGNDDRLKILNNSSDTLTLFWSLDYKDTTLMPYMMPPYYELPNLIIKPNENKSWPHKDCWELSFKYGSTDTLQIFIFSINTLRTTDWETIIAENKFLKHYNFTLKELNTINWQIVYEP